MKLIWKLRLMKDTRGQDLIEYALMAGFVAVAAGAIMPGVASQISTLRKLAPNPNQKLHQLRVAKWDGDVTPSHLCVVPPAVEPSLSKPRIPPHQPVCARFHGYIQRPKYVLPLIVVNSTGWYSLMERII
jgi:Flp pilus assembly pilin Flp